MLGGGTNASNSKAHYNFHRGNLPGKKDVEYPIVSGEAIWSPCNTDVSIKPENSFTYLNGEKVNGTETGLSGKYDLIELIITNGCTEAEGFAFDGRMIDNGSYAERSGGQRLAEVLIYDRTLTEEERLNVEHFLQMKWGLKKLKIGNDSDVTLELTPNGKVDLSGMTHSVANLEGVGLIENGSLQVLDSVSTRKAVENGTLQVNGGLELCDDSTISVDLVSSSEDLITVNGVCTLGARVQVNVRPRVETSAAAEYRIPIVRATEWKNESNLESWTVVGDLPPGYVGGISRQNDMIVLHVSRGGTLLLLK